MALFVSQAGQAVAKSLLATKWQADEDRQKEAQEKLDLYRDDYEEIIKTKMGELFVKENYERLKYHVNQSQNILKRVINEISTIYKAEPKRTLDPESDRYGEILKLNNIDMKIKRVNRYTNLLNNCLLKIGVRDGQLVYDIITPNLCWINQDPVDPTRATAVIYMVTLVNTKGSSEINYYYWDEQGIYQMLDKDLRVKEDIYDPGNYPYKDERGRFILPFVFFHKQEPDEAFWDQDSGRDLYNGTILTGIKMTLFDYYFKVCSFKQPYIIGDKIDVPNKQVFDPLNMYTASGENAEIGLLDMQINLNQLRDAIVYQVNSLVNNYGISSDQWSMSVSETSGRALKIKNRALLELREEQLPLYRNAEQDLFKKTRIVNNAHVGAEGIDWEKIPEEATFQIDFGEIDFPEDPNYEIDLEMKRLKSGIIGLGQFYQKFNPDIKSADDAEKEIIKNLEKLGKLREAHPTLDEALNFIMKNTEKEGQGKGTENSFVGEVK